MSTAKLYNGEYKSAIMQHAADTGHSCRGEDLAILDSDPVWRSRGVRESIYIRALNPSLNRRSERNDRYTLPSNYDSIIKSTIKQPPPPQPHTENETKTFTGDRRQGRPKQNNEQTAAKSIEDRPQSHPSHMMTTRRRARASEGAAGTT